MLLNRNISPAQTAVPPQDLPLDQRAAAYVQMLARAAPGFIEFRTGAGRVFRDLMVHWPTLDGWEDEAHEICERIADAVYPLAGALFAQAVEIKIVLSPAPLPGPETVGALCTYVVFDADSGHERRFFLSPHLTMPAPSALAIGGGIAVLCKPLHYRYHTLKDDRRKYGHPRIGIFELPQRLINEMYEKPDFVPRELQVISSFGAMIAALPARLEHSYTRSTILRATPRATTQSPARIRLVTSLSALPPPVRAVERKLMVAGMDRNNHSAELRLGLRRVAQSLRAQYPAAVIEEAGQRETKRRVPSLAALERRVEAVPRAATPARTPAPPAEAARMLRTALLAKEALLPPPVLAEARREMAAQPLPTEGWQPLNRAPQSLRPTIVESLDAATVPPREPERPTAQDQPGETPRAERTAAQDRPAQKRQEPQPRDEKEEPRATEPQEPEGKRRAPQETSRETPRPREEAPPQERYETVARSPEMTTAEAPAQRARFAVASAAPPPETDHATAREVSPEQHPHAKAAPPTAPTAERAAAPVPPPATPTPPQKPQWRRWLSVPTLAPLPLMSRLFGRK